ncbi:M48 family metallopeptidase [Helcobacillus massiliensis]|uniref:M48 family metallopeptidase n=1 Tax=Helcobacillus massiliensis TaxID=521392 RepID=UPI0021A59DF7|nr:M48 family metallopeptidase [Helcobacillus massiliensis]MCT1557399.1 M48 family metallopeptidase [Helcobacillus massiliensis]MCT2036878.1 M48 family metallopeptidase [Helcobacillus massiliensis]MCT2331684.1 M48 family metallopeptidase [Helcobacillus massiliensis]
MTSPQQPSSSPAAFGPHGPLDGREPVGRPRLFNGATRLGLTGDLAMRHPWELPLFAVAVLFTVGFNLAWLASIVVFIILVATGNDASVVDSLDPNLIQLFVIIGALPWILWILRALMYAQQRALAVRMSPTQFPEGYRMVCEAAQQFGMRRVPDAYVTMGSGVINAFAAGHGFRRYVVIHSDLFEVGGRVRDPEALRFVIAHEVGHHAAGHTGYFRILFQNLFYQVPILGKALSRAQEYTADNYGYSHVPNGAPGTMALLAGGKYLNAHVNVNELADRAATEKGLWVHLVQWTSTHPITTWRANALRDRTRAGRMWLRPKAPLFHQMLPAGSTFSKKHPTPEQAIELINRARAEGLVLDEEQFGRFPGAQYPAPASMRDLQIRAPYPPINEGTMPNS